MQIGEQLKEAREQKGLTLDDIQATTKIQKRYLVAIEQDDFHALPGRFYARAFIKEYAKAVGIDDEELLADFDEENVNVEEEETISYSRLKQSSRAGRGSSILSYLPTVIVVILVIGIIVVSWFLYQKSLSEPTGDSIEEQESDEIIQREPNENKQVLEDEEENKKDMTTDETNEVEEDDEKERFTVEEEGMGNSPESTVSYKFDGDTLTVKLEATEDSYVQVSDGSGTSHLDQMFSAGMTEEFEISADEAIYFNIGHAPGMKIYINDDLLQYPVNPEQSVHQKIWLNTN